ncbi:hypothetical protein CTEN210_13134 [Chaetoceros tenuissimus]|uniref:Matrin-type domain-containing protein n=1 Tax=Chaetoceros tenuissimus TaxID=426638 RepID=A0AAD3HB61_9STRA|nr:hypothetical protein CTEN210_13134 [Chaetoceros tenuissimus]
MDPQSSSQISYVFRTPRGKSTVANIPLTASYDTFLRSLLERAAHIDREFDDAQSVNYQMSRLTIGVHRKLVQEAGRLVRRRTDLNRYVENRACQNCDEHTREASYNRTGELDSESNYNCSSCITSFSNSSVNFSNLAYVVLNGKVLGRNEYEHLTQKFSESPSPETVHHISLRVRMRGGVDRQNRVGSKFGGGGVSSEQQSERERKERLRQLALETVDLAKDPYLMRNHLGTYECKLCLTLHTNEGNYLAHTQGKKHQAGLARRAAMEAKLQGKQDVGPSLPVQTTTKTVQRVKIGRPGYEISKSRHHETNQRCLSFQLHFPEIDANCQPRHRFMSAFEQRKESPPDRRYQYLLIAAEPYETVAFKIPNEKIDREEGKFVTNWNEKERTFTLTLYFVDDVTQKM